MAQRMRNSTLQCDGAKLKRLRSSEQHTVCDGLLPGSEVEAV
jgi:hypothetical protein